MFWRGFAAQPIPAKGAADLLVGTLSKCGVAISLKPASAPQPDPFHAPRPR